MEVKQLTNVTDLRAILADEIMKIRDGRSTAANVNAITKAAESILNSVRLEMEYSKLISTTPNIAFIGAVAPDSTPVLTQ